MQSVLTYHTNPLTCGVARFNQALAVNLGVPIYPLFSPAGLAAKQPLISIKVSEFTSAHRDQLRSVSQSGDVWPGLQLFFHDYSASPEERQLIDRATTVYCGNEALTRELGGMHHNVVSAWCPGHLFDIRRIDPDIAIRVFAFGMAHKVRADHYIKLRELLERTGQEYAVYISAAIHEGTSLDDSFTAAYDELRMHFGHRVHFLGFISDTLLYNYLVDCTFFAAFFPDGVRANNTSVNTAMQCGAVVLTNLDASSPASFRHLHSVLDISKCASEGLPLDPVVLGKIAENGRELANRFGWDPLVKLIVATGGDGKRNE